MPTLTPALLEFKRLLEQLPALREIAAAAAQRVQEQTLEDEEGRREFLLFLLLVFRRDAEILAQQLVEGSISLAQWEATMAARLKDVLIAATATARAGDWELISKADLAQLEAALKEQLEYLYEFAQDIYDKVQAEEPLTIAVHTRAKLYAGAAWSLYWLITQAIKRREGATQVRLVTVGDERVCEICQGIEAQGWMPIGEVVAGQIHPGCRCNWEFR